MSWSDIKKAEMSSEEANAQGKERQADAAALAKCYAAVFRTEQGKKVLADLTNRYIMNNDTPLNATNITYEAGYRNGEAGIVKYLIHQMNIAKIL